MLISDFISANLTACSIIAATSQVWWMRTATSKQMSHQGFRVFSQTHLATGEGGNMRAARSRGWLPSSLSCWIQGQRQWRSAEPAAGESEGRKRAPAAAGRGGGGKRSRGRRRRDFWKQALWLLTYIYQVPKQPFWFWFFFVFPPIYLSIYLSMCISNFLHHFLFYFVVFPPASLCFLCPGLHFWLPPVISAD